MILGIVTARLGSSRLPAKALLPMGNSTMVGHVIEAMVGSNVDQTVLCTPDSFLGNFVDAPTLVWTSSRNVLGELMCAADTYNADTIVRVTADCPFVTSDIINQVIDFHIKSGAEYTYNHHDSLPSKTKEGIDVEVVSYEALKRFYNEMEKYHEIISEHLFIDCGVKISRLDMEEERDVFSVNTLDDYIRAYEEINNGRTRFW